MRMWPVLFSLCYNSRQLGQQTPEWNVAKQDSNNNDNNNR